MRTAWKIAFAKAASAGIVGIRRLFGADHRVIVTRGGFRWSLDLSEGFDLSVYLLGSVEPRVIRNYPALVRPGSVVIDVGANIGGHALPFARLAGSRGTVVAIEPSDWAFRKMSENISLNADCGGTVRARQALLSSEAAGMAPDGTSREVYASWPLGSGEEVHPKHFGKKTATVGAHVDTLDGLVGQEKLPRVDLIKIDVDGDEWRVLQGSRSTIARWRPLIVMEFAPYLFSESDFRAMVEALKGWGYRFFDVETGKVFPEDPAVIRNLIPDGAVRNVLLKPSPKPDFSS